MLQLGEVLPHIDVEAEIEQVEQEKLLSMDMAVAAGTTTEEEDEQPPADEGEEESQTRAEVRRRLQELAGENSDD